MREYFTKTGVLSRGWTKELIDELLGAPDKTRGNQYRAGSLICQYSVDRVMTAEKSEAFRNAMKALRVRRKSAAKGVRTKSTALMKKINDTKIDIPSLDVDEVIASAIADYNSFHANDAHGNAHATPNDDEAFLQRITVNYLRHLVGPYEKALIDIVGKTGKRAAYAAIKSNVLCAIARQYPYLKSECDRQSADIAMLDMESIMRSAMSQR